MNRVSGQILTLASILFAAVVIFGFSQQVVAANLYIDPLGGGDYGTLSDTGLGTADPVVVASQIVNVLLRLLGLFCLLLMLYAGFRWIWAKGNEEDITVAKDILRGTIIGLIIIMSSFGVMQWVFYNLAKITNAA